MYIPVAFTDDFDEFNIRPSNYPPYGPLDEPNTFRINVPESKILPILWNMKEWYVSVSFALNVEYEGDFDGVNPPPQRRFAGNLNGKFLSAVYSASGYVYPERYFGASSTNAEPALKVDFPADGKSITSYAVMEEETYEGYYVFPVFPFTWGDWTEGGGQGRGIPPFILPTYDMGSFAFTYLTDDNLTHDLPRISIRDHTDNESGWCEGGVEIHDVLSESSLYIFKIFIKGDGTVDVICRIKLESQLNAALVRDQIAPNTTGYGDYITNYEPVTFSFLGETVSAYIALGEGETLTEFNLSYDVTVTEEWTY
jgi:hypothetical protein